MKRIYMVLCACLLLVMLGVGTVSLFDKDPSFSQIENRVLGSFPKITVSGLLDGSFTEELAAYYADTFPGREGLAEKYDQLSGFYFFGGRPGEQTASDE